MASSKTRNSDALNAPFRTLKADLAKANAAKADSKARKAEADAKKAPQKKAPAKPKAEKPKATETLEKRPQPPARATGTSEHPMAHYSYEDRVAFSVAFGDLKPLRTDPKHSKRASTPRLVADPAPALALDAVARKRLDALVNESVRFRVARDGYHVEGLRVGAPDKSLTTLISGSALPQATVDLHGMTSDVAASTLRAFLRDQRAKRCVVVRVIHGKGNHSEGGGVLADVCVDTLCKQAAAFVEAFASAPAKFGGEGALLVKLTRQ